MTPIGALNEKVSLAPSRDRDTKCLAKREILLTDREHEKLFHLVGRRKIAGELWLHVDDLLRDFKISAKKKSGPTGCDFHRLDPTLEIGFRSVFHKLTDDDT